MNTAIVIPTIKAGGAEKQAVLLANYLSNSHNVSFIIFYGEEPKEEKHITTLKNKGVEIVSLEGSVITKTRCLIKSLKERRIEVAFNYLTMCDSIGCYAERKAGVPVIYNGIRSSWLPKRKLLLERFCHNHWATGTILNCERSKIVFGDKGFNKDKLFVIKNCFPKISEYHERAAKGTITIITVARFDTAKDYETSIKTVSAVYKRCLRIRYYIVGHGGLEPDVRRWVQKYGIQDITEIFVNPSNIADLLQKSDIFFATSLSEGTSNALMEALNASLPIVCTDVGDNALLVRHEINGFVHAVGDSSSMADSLIRLVTNSELRRSFGRISNQILRQDYSFEEFSKRYNELLSQ